MRVIGTMMLLGCIAAVAGCNSHQSALPVPAPLATVFDAKGCPREVRVDQSCANVPGATAGSVCRERQQKISWQAVDSNGNATSTEFVVRFKTAEQILDPDSRTARCSASDRGMLKCKIKRNAARGRDYKYVVQVDDTECPVLDPRVWVK